MPREYYLLIDGELVSAASSFDVINPATERPIASCPKANTALLNDAVAAAKRAFSEWSARPIEDRASLVEALGNQLEERAAEFAQLLTSEQGKPHDQAMSEIMGSVFTLRAFAKMRLENKVLIEGGDHYVVEHRTPLGVIGAIMPWNFPVILLMSKLGPALIAGNTLVAKPAPTTPLTTLLFGEICKNILPSGVVNIICDENDLGEVITNHPDIAKIAFTGSTATGKRVMASAANGIKRISLELGGNDAAIVLDDVDPKCAAEKIYHGAMTNAGQICVAIKRVYVPEKMYDDFCDAIAEIAGKAIVDDGSKQGTTIGPIQNRKQYERVCELLEDARGQGVVVAGGEALKRDGYFVSPTIIRDLSDNARLVCEEQFGPVLPVLKYNDIDEVIERANNTEYGLGGSIWGRDINRAVDIAKKIEAGTVWVNQFMAIDPNIPFRGSKQSGLGGELGEFGFHEYTQPHIVNAVSFNGSASA